MNVRLLYLIPGLAIGFALGVEASQLRLGADRDAWIERTSRCVDTLAHANDAKQLCISTLENVCAKLAQVEGADVIQAMLMHAEPYRNSRRSARSPLGANTEILTISSSELAADHDGT